MENDLFEIAKELQLDLDARRRRKVFAESRGPKSIEEAYALQRALRKFRESRGEKVIGFKIGFTSAGVRRNAKKIMGLDESVHGYLWDTESFANSSIVDSRRLGIEGELMITILSTVDQNPRNWEISYEPIIELHIMGASASSMWDGPVSDDEGKRGLELIGTNCVHTGVVRCNQSNRCRLDEIPLDAVMSVSLDHEEVEKVTLRELEIGSSQGPVATLSWLLQTLKKEGNSEEGVIRDGAQILCSTPGALHRVLPGQMVTATFFDLETSCYAQGHQN